MTLHPDERIEIRCAIDEILPFDVAFIDCSPSVDLSYACGPQEFALPYRTIPFVNTAGGVAAYAAPRPKSEVLAVRAGPVLANNLRSALTGKT